MTTSARTTTAALIALATLSIGYAVILHIETAKAKAELSRMEEELEQRHIEAEAALLTTIEQHRQAIAKKDTEIQRLTELDADLTAQMNANRTLSHEKRIEIIHLDSAGVGRELRCVFARRGVHQ